MRKTCHVGVLTIRGPSVRSTAWSTFTIWAMQAIFTRPQWLLKMFSVRAATRASRMVFCW